jgi:Leucine-rich repeat (LRR) protein
MEDYMNKENDPLVSGELSELKNVSEEFGLNLFNQLKTILKYYKYLTIELKDYSMIFKVDNMLEANRTFEELRCEENISQY